MPQVSIIMPAFRSEATLDGCLRAMLAQDFADFELILVDSSPNDRATRYVREHFPRVQVLHSAERLLPHAARNRGVALAQGALLVFTDPDVYPPPDWLTRLVGAHRATGYIIVGAVACYGRRWIDTGVHLCKFDYWLPGGRPRPVSISPTVSMLCSRAQFDPTGGFHEDMMLGDTLMSWDLTRRGETLWFVPDAVLDHHHLTSWRAFLRERYQRGREFRLLRSQEPGWTPPRAMMIALATFIPLRLLKLVARTARLAARAGILSDFMRTLPIVVSGHGAWLAGELAGTVATLRAGFVRRAGRSRQRRA